MASGHLFWSFGMNVDLWRERLAVRDRGRGRPRTADADLRNNKYRDENGQYQLSEGLKPWHERLVDYLLLHPHAKTVDVARFFHVSPVWAGELMATDAFKEYYSRRMQEHQRFVSVSIVSKMQGLAAKAMDKVAEKLDSGDVPMGQALEAVTIATRGLGFGLAGAGGVRVQIDSNSKGPVFIGVSSQVIEQARKDMELQRQTPTTAPAEAYREVTQSLEMMPEQYETLGNVEEAVVLGSDESGSD